MSDAGEQMIPCAKHRSTNSELAEWTVAGADLLAHSGRNGSALLAALCPSHVQLS